jgi:hypothetical protein
MHMSDKNEQKYTARIGGKEAKANPKTEVEFKKEFVAKDRKSSK